MYSNCNTIFLFQTTEIYSVWTMIIFWAAQCILLPTTTKRELLSISVVVYTTIHSPPSEGTLESTNELMVGSGHFLCTEGFKHLFDGSVGTS